MSALATGVPTLPVVCSMAVMVSAGDDALKPGAWLECCSVTVSTPEPLTPVTVSVAVKVTG